jgi:hypothetical protein
MPWIKIFISHSTKTEEAQEFLDAVRNALDQDFDLRLDQILLEGGDNWRASIYQWMDEAHGAVLLLTKEALQSKFVQMEAMILSWRSFRQPEFALVPVLVGGVTVDDIKGGLFGEMALGTFQVVTLKDPAAAQDVARCLKKLQKPNPSRTPREILESRIGRLLKKEQVGEDVLRDVGVKLFGWTAKDFASNTDYFEKFTTDILSENTPVACSAINELKEQGMEKGKAQELLELVFPFWVEEETAKPVARLALSETAKRSLSLDTDEPYTVHSYIGRSSYKPLSHGFRCYELQPPQLQDSFQDFRGQILKAVKEESGIKGAAADQIAKNIIKKRNDKRPPEPVFVLFPPGLVPDAILLDKLRNEFETVTFFVLAGDEPEEKLDLLGGKVHILQPLDKEKEAEAIYEYYMLRGSLNSK